MAKFTQNNQKERISRIKFEEFIYPWGCTSPEHDVGIDLIVQPFDEKSKQSDGSLLPFNKRFLVQLKSTSSERSVIGEPRISIDVQHLVDWKNQEDKVMILRYHIDENVFYFTWIDDIDIKTTQKYQTIYLDKKFDILNKDNVKESIIRYISPIKAGELTYVPDIGDPFKGEGYISLFNIRSREQLSNFINDKLDDWKKMMLHESFIYEYQVILADSPNDFKSRFNLAAYYIQRKKFEEAAKELAIIIRKFNKVEAKILFSILKNKDYEVLDGLSKYEFAYYVQWKQPIIPGVTIEAYLVNDSVEYELPYNKLGTRLPKVPPAKFFRDLKFNFTRENSSITNPIPFLDPEIKLTILGKNDELLYKYGVLVGNTTIVI